MRLRLLQVALLACSSVLACSDDDETSSNGASQAAGSGAASGGDGSGASGSGGAGADGGTGAAGGASGGSAGAPAGSGGRSGGACDGKACGSACMSEAGEGMCDDGGSCVVVPVSCAGYMPCADTQCGTPCSSCDPDDPACDPVPTAVCDITGMCIYPPPACD